MDEPCVHCGEPIEYLVSGHGPAWSHTLSVHTLSGRLCADGSGHVACPAQGGIE